MPSDQSASPRLSPAQRELLVAIAGYAYGEGHVRPSGRRTADILVRHGLLERIGQGWHKVTPAGRIALDQQRVPEEDR